MAKHGGSNQTMADLMVAESAVLLGLLLAGNILDAYEYLYKPPFAPPGWLFCAAWPVLYALTGLAVRLVRLEPGAHVQKQPALLLYGAQLLCSIVWFWIFFRFEYFWLSLLLLLLLDFLALAAFGRFGGVNPAAAVLAFPGLAWFAFVTYLNLGVALLN